MPTTDMGASAKLLYGESMLLNFPPFFKLSQDIRTWWWESSLPVLMGYTSKEPFSIEDIFTRSNYILFSVLRPY